MAERYEVLLQPEALKGLESAYRFIQADSLDSANKWIDGITRAIESFPKRCPLAPESEAFAQEIRQLLYGKRNNIYRILFTIEANSIHVLHVRHGAQKWIVPNDEGRAAHS